MFTKDGKQISVLQGAATLRFSCPKCNAPIKLHIAVAPLMANWSGSAGTVAALKSAFGCGNCDSSFPSTFYWAPNSLAGNLDDYPHHPIEVDYIPLDGDKWENANIPLSPDEQLGDALEGIHSVLTPLPKEAWRANLILKMAFSQAIGAMEAFLCDTLMAAVMRSPRAIRRLLDTDKHLQDVKLRLVEVLADPDIVISRVRKHLRDIVYHKLDRVNALYLSALEVDILADKGRTERLMRSVQIRHDIVHRNGKTTEDEPVNLDVQCVETLMNDIQELVDDIMLKLYQFQMREKTEQASTVE